MASKLQWAMIPVLLLAAFLGARGLNADGLWYDEIRTMVVAGAAHYGPLSPAGIWERIATESPQQSLGYPLTVAAWGQMAGWTEVPLRALAWFFGLLTLACVYRFGHEAASPLVGFVGAAVLATSPFFIYYTHELRAFALAALSAIMVTWSYWRITYRKPDLPSQIALVLGGVIALYSHYFAASVLVALGAYHLLFAPKTRNWWRPVGLMGLVGLIFLPWFRVFLIGFQEVDENVGREYWAMTGPETVERFAFFMGNGIHWLLVPFVIAALFAPVPRREKLYLWFIPGVALVIIVVANHFVSIMKPTQVRYMLPVWPGWALILGLGVLALAQWRRALAGGVLAAWMVFGVWSVYGNPLLDEGVTRVGGSLPWHELVDVMAYHSQPGDVLAMHAPRDQDSYRHPMDHYLGPLVTRSELLLTLDTEDNAIMEAYLSDPPRVWMLIDQRYDALPRLAEFQGILRERFTYCDTYMDAPRLALYVRVPAYCPGGVPVVTYAGQIALTGMEPLPDDVGDQLVLQTGWSVADSIPDQTYSIALHILHAESGELVAQADVPLPGTPFGPVQANISLDGVPDGPYELHTIVYNWQTGERLTGVLHDQDITGERLLIDAFQKTATTG